MCIGGGGGGGGSGHRGVEDGRRDGGNVAGEIVRVARFVLAAVVAPLDPSKRARGVATATIDQRRPLVVRSGRRDVGQIDHCEFLLFSALVVTHLCVVLTVQIVRRCHAGMRFRALGRSVDG